MRALQLRAQEEPYPVKFRGEICVTSRRGDHHMDETLAIYEGGGGHMSHRLTFTNVDRRPREISRAFCASDSFFLLRRSEIYPTRPESSGECGSATERWRIQHAR